MAKSWKIVGKLLCHVIHPKTVRIFPHRAGHRSLRVTDAPSSFLRQRRRPSIRDNSVWRCASRSAARYVPQCLNRPRQSPQSLGADAHSQSEGIQEHSSSFSYRRSDTGWPRQKNSRPRRLSRLRQPFYAFIETIQQGILHAGLLRNLHPPSGDFS